MDQPGNEVDLKAGRDDYARGNWVAAYERLSAADAAHLLGKDDLESLAWTAALTGHYETLLDALERLYVACCEEGDHARAARAAFWAAFCLFPMNQPARASGWLGRAQRAVTQVGAECVEQGYILIPMIAGQLGAGDCGSAAATAADAAAIGERFGEPDLVAFARQLEGRALMRQGRISDGMRLLDEVMLSATSGEMSPFVTGLLYCSVIATCQQVYALDRAREWTAVLTDWCEQQPQAVSFTGTCLVHRAEIMQVGGAWSEALDEAQRACELLSPSIDRDAIADAHYQQAEVHRLRGAFAAAEAAYRRSSEYGREPQPGLALLRMAEGRRGDAIAAIRRLLDTTEVAWQRTRYLPACVEIALAAGDNPAAQEAAGELEAIAAQFDSEILAAMAGHARGAVALAQGHPRSAIGPLRDALEVWQRIDAPYIVARIRVLVGRACRVLGDSDGASLEFHVARQLFERLEAAPDLAALDAAQAGTEGGSLTGRELQVLRLVAAGQSNKAIAGELGLSVRTIDRHVSNIFTKLDVDSRTEAAAFAIRSGIL